MDVKQSDLGKPHVHSRITSKCKRILDKIDTFEDVEIAYHLNFLQSFVISNYNYITENVFQICSLASILSITIVKLKQRYFVKNGVKLVRIKYKDCIDNIQEKVRKLEKDTDYVTLRDDIDALVYNSMLPEFNAECGGIVQHNHSIKLLDIIMNLIYVYEVQKRGLATLSTCRRLVRRRSMAPRIRENFLHYLCTRDNQVMNGMIAFVAGTHFQWFAKLHGYVNNKQTQNSETDYVLCLSNLRDYRAEDFKKLQLFVVSRKPADVETLPLALYNWIVLYTLDFYFECQVGIPKWFSNCALPLSRNWSVVEETHRPFPCIAQLTYYTFCIKYMNIIYKPESISTESSSVDPRLHIFECIECWYRILEKDLQSRIHDKYINVPFSL